MGMLQCFEQKLDIKKCMDQNNFHNLAPILRNPQGIANDHFILFGIKE